MRRGLGLVLAAVLTGGVLAADEHRCENEAQATPHANPPPFFDVRKTKRAGRFESTRPSVVFARQALTHASPLQDGGLVVGRGALL